MEARENAESPPLVAAAAGSEGNGSKKPNVRSFLSVQALGKVPVVLRFPARPQSHPCSGLARVSSWIHHWASPEQRARQSRCYSHAQASAWRRGRSELQHVSIPIVGRVNFLFLTRSLIANYKVEERERERERSRTLFWNVERVTGAIQGSVTAGHPLHDPISEDAVVQGHPVRGHPSRPRPRPLLLLVFYFRRRRGLTAAELRHFRCELHSLLPLLLFLPCVSCIPCVYRVPIGGDGGASGDGEGLLAAESDEDDGTGDGHGGGQGHRVRGHGGRRRKHKEEKGLAAWETVTCEAGVNTECFLYTWRKDSV
ncbi:hypothetical protein B296_00039657 [Ensete ventricosum]|uniref:Uncharacterized protein n=1 Tax=Ensete ventricosum TaxID=4639 RepID=A0A426YPX5_ENSVE|nr:hypothetical protein B296_00039657 [Ensete ventricosum]